MSINYQEMLQTAWIQKSELHVVAVSAVAQRKKPLSSVRSSLTGNSKRFLVCMPVQKAMRFYFFKLIEMNDTEVQ